MFSVNYFQSKQIPNLHDYFCCLNRTQPVPHEEDHVTLVVSDHSLRTTDSVDIKLLYTLLLLIKKEESCEIDHLFTLKYFQVNVSRKRLIILHNALNL